MWGGEYLPDKTTDGSQNTAKHNGREDTRGETRSVATPTVVQSNV